jgi:hypothetical protein
VELLVHPCEDLFRLRSSLCGRTLFGCQRRRDGLAQFLLHMEDVRRVMRAEVV